MLTGCEIIHPDLGKVPALVDRGGKMGALKFRHPSLWEHRLHQYATVMVTRPASEGGDRGAIVDGFNEHLRGYLHHGQGKPWRHVLWNEQNHPQSLWGANGYDLFYQEARRALLEIPSDWHRVCYTGGHVRYLRVPEWTAMCERLCREFPGLRRSSHAYSTISGADLIVAAGEQGGAMIDEFNHSGPGVDTETRVLACIEAVTAWSESRSFDVAILFCSTSWQDHNGVEYGFSVEDQHRILSAANTTVSSPPPIEQPEPPIVSQPKESPMFNPDPFGLSHPDHGVYKAAQERGAVILAPEADDTEHGVAGLRVVRTNRGRIWWHPETGSLFESPFDDAA